MQPAQNPLARRPQSQGRGTSARGNHQGLLVHFAWLNRVDAAIDAEGLCVCEVGWGVNNDILATPLTNPTSLFCGRCSMISYLLAGVKSIHDIKHRLGFRRRRGRSERPEKGGARENLFADSISGFRTCIAGGQFIWILAARLETITKLMNTYVTKENAGGRGVGQGVKLSWLLAHPTNKGNQRVRVFMRMSMPSFDCSVHRRLHLLRSLGSTP